MQHLKGVRPKIKGQTIKDEKHEETKLEKAEQGMKMRKLDMFECGFTCLLSSSPTAS